MKLRKAPLGTCTSCGDQRTPIVYESIDRRPGPHGLYVRSVTRHCPDCSLSYEVDAAASRKRENESSMQMVREMMAEGTITEAAGNLLLQKYEILAT